MDVTVYPGPLNGRIDAPPSKSYTHRALIAGFLTRRQYRVRRPLVAEDTLVTRRGLGRLGARVRASALEWTVRPSPHPSSAGRSTIDCAESGTTLRLLAGIAAAQSRPVRFVGRPPLARRPIGPLADALVTGGAIVSCPPGRSLPLDVRGPLHAGRFRLPGDVSSQFVSSLLLALPTLPGDSTLEVVGPRVSEPYISATLAVLRAHRVRVRATASGWKIPGKQPYHGHSFEVPGDASSAAYWWAAAAVTGGEVTVGRIPSEWPQADLKILEILTAAGAAVRRSGRSVRVAGPTRRPIRVDLTPAPDLYPLVGVLAALTPGASRILGAAHVALKESDRRAATIDLVRRLGARCTASRAGLTIHGVARPRPIRYAGWTDHRLVMSAAVAALAAPAPSRIGDRRAVGKSYPAFWNDAARLGVRLEGRP